MKDVMIQTLRAGAEISVKRTARLIGAPGKPTGLNTVLRLIEAGEIQARRLTQRGWYLINYASVIDYLNRTRK